MLIVYIHRTTPVVMRSMVVDLIPFKTNIHIYRCMFCEVMSYMIRLCGLN